MQLLVTILKRVDLMDELIKNLAKAGVKGATILDGTGMAEALMNMEDLPLFGVLRRIMTDDEREVSKVMMIVLKDDMVKDVISIIKAVVGDLNGPNTGIIFTMPITHFEGIGD